MYGYSPIQGTRSRLLLKVLHRFIPLFFIFFGCCFLDLRITTSSNVDLVFFNNLDINYYDYVGKLPEQHFSVWLFSNPGDKISFLLKFNEARISECNFFTFSKNSNVRFAAVFFIIHRIVTKLIDLALLVTPIL